MARFRWAKSMAGRIKMGRTFLGGTRLVELESVRGIAALVVLVHHASLAFFPAEHGLLFPDTRVSLFGTPLFALINGSAAVTLFFVLSGFVLTVRAFKDRSIWPLISGAIKRWPRLVLLVLAVNVISGFLAGWSLYKNADAAEMIGSPWLGWFFHGPADGWATVRKSIEEGAFWTFFSGSNYFNSPLWTMRHEFYGSLVALAVAAAAVFAGRKMSGVLICVGLAFSFATNAHVGSFIVGVALAAFYSSLAWSIYTAWLSRRGALFWTASLAILVYLLGYHEGLAPSRPPIGAYVLIKPLYDLSPSITRAVIHSVASAAIILVVLAMSTRLAWLRGSFGFLLGQLSFAIYLIHVPVICFAGSWIYLSLVPIFGEPVPLFVAAIASIALTVALAVPLSRLDAAWIQLLRTAQLQFVSLIGTAKLERLTLAVSPRSVLGSRTG